MGCGRMALIQRVSMPGDPEAALVTDAPADVVRDVEAERPDPNAKVEAETEHAPLDLPKEAFVESNVPNSAEFPGS